jgi:hypothetical protein
MVLCRNFRWSPLEKCCAAVGLSLLFQFLIALGVYVLKLDPRWHYLGGIVGLIGTLLSSAEIRRLIGARPVRRAIISYAAVFLAGLTMIAVIRDLAGGEWFGDWVEHFQRTGFWLGKFPLDYRFIGDYPLPARPPMANVLCASLLAQSCPTGSYPFAVYQLALLMLCSLIALPIGLVTRAVWPRGGRWTPAALALLLMNPMFVQNLTYPWTRHLTTFYILSSVALYLSGWRKRDRTRTVAAFVLLTTAMIIHYSTGPYLLFLALHYLFAVWRHRRDRWTELAVIITPCALVLSTWVGWSIRTYGVAVTFGANSVITDSSRFSTEGNVAKIAGNLYRSIVPLFLRTTPETIQRQESSLGFFRDYVFVTYQQNAIFALGSVGALLVVLLLWKLWRGHPSRRERLFWLPMILVVGFLGIAVNGTPDWYGYAHIILQPLLYTGICLVAAGVTSLPRPWRVLLLLGLTLDFLLGILLHLHLEHYAGQDVLALSPAAMSNMDMKLHAGIRLVGDRVGELGGPLQLLLVAAFAATLYWLATRWLTHPRHPLPVS